MKLYLCNVTLAVTVLYLGRLQPQTPLPPNGFFGGVQPYQDTRITDGHFVSWTSPRLCMDGHSKAAGADAVSCSSPKFNKKRLTAVAAVGVSLSTHTGSAEWPEN